MSTTNTDDKASKESVNNTCDAILMARALIGTPEVMKMDARNSVQHALSFEQLRIDCEEQQICIGNPRGLDILKEVASLRERLDTEKLSCDQQITSLEQQLATQKLLSDGQISSVSDELVAANRSLQEEPATEKLSREDEFATEELSRDRQMTSLREQMATEQLAWDEQITSIQAKITSLNETNISLDATLSSHEARIRTLISGNEAYRNIRNRFISTFKRDLLHKESDEDEAIITGGNHNAHGGDVEVDATLYNMPEGGRNDSEVFKKLYGLLPETVLQYISK